MFKLSENSKLRRDGVDNRLIEISNLALKISTIDFGHPADAGIRTAERQNELFKTGKSLCDGYKIKSKHQSGKALDFYAYVDGKASWKIEHLTLVAAAFLQAASVLGYKLHWGGFWKTFQDYPHVELVD
jgi:peptidoglycan L-alanyl-D-glutamate endopeptidase CwlK